MTTLTNPANPYHCAACGAELDALIMQHFPRRTIVLGACSNPNCKHYLSHLAAEIVDEPAQTRRATLEMIARRRNVAIGVYEYDKPVALAKAV